MLTVVDCNQQQKQSYRFFSLLLSQTSVSKQAHDSLANNGGCGRCCAAAAFAVAVTVVVDVALVAIVVVAAAAVVVAVVVVDVLVVDVAFVVVADAVVVVVVVVAVFCFLCLRSFFRKQSFLLRPVIMTCDLW